MKLLDGSLLWEHEMPAGSAAFRFDAQTLACCNSTGPSNSSTRRAGRLVLGKRETGAAWQTHGLLYAAGLPPVLPRALPTVRTRIRARPISAHPHGEFQPGGDENFSLGDRSSESFPGNDAERHDLSTRSTVGGPLPRHEYLLNTSQIEKVAQPDRTKGQFVCIDKRTGTDIFTADHAPNLPIYSAIQTNLEQGSARAPYLAKQSIRLD